MSSDLPNPYAAPNMRSDAAARRSPGFSFALATVFVVLGLGTLFFGCYAIGTLVQVTLANRANEEIGIPNMVAYCAGYLATSCGWLFASYYFAKSSYGKASIAAFLGLLSLPLITLVMELIAK